MFGIVWHCLAWQFVCHCRSFTCCFPLLFSLPNVLLIQVTAAGPTPGDKVGQTCCADVISNSEYLGIIFVYFCYFQMFEDMKIYEMWWAQFIPCSFGLSQQWSEGAFRAPTLETLAVTWTGDTAGLQGVPSWVKSSGEHWVHTGCTWRDLAMSFKSSAVCLSLIAEIVGSDALEHRSSLAFVESHAWESGKWWQWSFSQFDAFSIPCFLAGLTVPRLGQKSFSSESISIVMPLSSSQLIVSPF